MISQSAKIFSKFIMEKILFSALKWYLNIFKGLKITKLISFFVFFSMFSKYLIVTIIVSDKVLLLKNVSKRKVEQHLTFLINLLIICLT